MADDCPYSKYTWKDLVKMWADGTKSIRQFTADYGLDRTKFSKYLEQYIPEVTGGLTVEQARNRVWNRRHERKRDTLSEQEARPLQLARMHNEYIKRVINKERGRAL